MNVMKPPPAPTEAVAPDLQTSALLAHDLRGCLEGILGGARLLDRAELRPQVRAQAERIAAASRALERLLVGLIGAEGRPADDARPVDMAGLLDDLRRRWTGEALEHDMAFSVAAGPDVPKTLRVERVALERILGNLIGNALKQTAGRAPGRAVHLAAESTSCGGLAFRVLDDGPGLEPEALAAVLRGEPPTAEARPPVHGLGLHIVRDLTERMGGSLAFDSPPAGGLEAVLRFPAALCQPQAAPGALAQARPVLTGLRVLLAEDNPTNQMVAVQMLRALGAEVTLASDGVEALEAFEAAPFDLVLVDIEMPRLSGLDVIRAVRGRGDDRADTPVVALTAYALREHRERIAAAGASGLVSKPVISIDALGRALAEFLPRKSDPPSAAGAHPAAASDAVIDQATYAALAEAIGAEMMDELLDKVAADLTATRDALAAGRDPLDRAPIRSASHILISVSGAIGAVRLQARAQSTNTAAHRPDDAALAAEIDACLPEIDAALDFTLRRRAAG